MKKNTLILIVFLTTINVACATPVKLAVRNGVSGSTKTAIENNVSRLLTAINDCLGSRNEALVLTNVNITPGAATELRNLWSHDRFSCTDEEIVEDVLTIRGGYQIRNIPLMCHPKDTICQDYKEAVIDFDRNGRITSFLYTLSPELYSKDRRLLMQDPTKDVRDINVRQQVIGFVEKFRTAYNLRDINFLNDVFSENALIITGRVVTIAKSDVTLNEQKVITYKKETKREYLNKLSRIFKYNKYINVEFDSLLLVKHPNKEHIYGVTVHQRWTTSSYQDDGWVFLLWDFTDEERPKIHVRTWQPEFIDDNKTQRLSKEEIISLSNFNIMTGNK